MNFLYPLEGDWERFGDESLVGLFWITGLTSDGVDEVYVTLAHLVYEPATSSSDRLVEVTPLYGFGAPGPCTDAWPHSVLLFQEVEAPPLPSDRPRGASLPLPWEAANDVAAVPPGVLWVAGEAPEYDIDVDLYGETRGAFTGHLVLVSALAEVGICETDGYPVVDPVNLDGVDKVWSDETVIVGYSQPVMPDSVSPAVLRRVAKECVNDGSI
ncbi:MAG: hypothetical protein AWU57_45 [Marinobacter sp. T13-3]|nr:MAG: hypothetical protein AWU57_45 [Marinobacter sp. T13-3]